MHLTNITANILANGRERLVRTEQRVIWLALSRAYVVQERGLFARYTMDGHKIRREDWRNVRLATPQDMNDVYTGRYECPDC
jgi:hypothetical protein